MSRPPVSVVVCAYTLDRWDDLQAALNSAASQFADHDELVLVVDYNPALLDRSVRELVEAHPQLRVLANHRKQGLSGARNTAVEQVTHDIVVFLDDDAAAEPGWLDALIEPYADPAVMAVGGVATPRWPDGEARPVTLPTAQISANGELDWVVGCTYNGQPLTKQPVRNLMGCNMSFRRQIFTRVGGFSENLGRVGKTPLGCEETELCIRAHDAFPDAQIIFQPAARVRHHVSSDRLTWKYLRRRCFAEGLSKAAVATMVGQQAGLSSERSYAAKVLPGALLRELTAAVGRRETDWPRRLGGAVAIVLALASTTSGYLRGRAVSASVTSHSTPRLELPAELVLVGS